ncbi:MAG TPA: mechanosensitive ion channel family protein [Reyranella sp.]
MSFRDFLAKADEYLPWIPNWLWAALMLVMAAAVALLLHRAVVRLMRRLVSPQRAFLQSLISATDGPIRMALVIVAVAIILPATPLDRDAQAVVGRALVVAFILLVGWSATAAIALASDFYLRRASIATDNPLARKHITQVRVLRRVTETLVIIVTVAAALMTFDAVKQYGVSLIASAGAAGIIVGLAARPLLTNLIAGIQLAITQPIRIGDAVIVENEWGWVEEITGTYVVIKIWDWRRLVVPLSYFLDKPFQNWTLQGTDLIGSVFLWVDYTVPVAHVRAKLEEIVRTTRLWSGEVVNLQVVDTNEQAVQLRALVSAHTSEQVWDLRCEVREKLIVFLQQSCPTALPKQRAELIELERPRSAA